MWIHSQADAFTDYRLPRGFVTFLESKTQDEETQVRIESFRSEFTANLKQKNISSKNLHENRV